MVQVYSVFGMPRCSLSMSISFNSKSEMRSLPAAAVGHGGRVSYRIEGRVRERRKEEGKKGEREGGRDGMGGRAGGKEGIASASAAT